MNYFAAWPREKSRTGRVDRCRWSALIAPVTVTGRCAHLPPEIDPTDGSFQRQKTPGPWSLIQITRPAIVVSGLCRGCGRGQCVGSALRDGAAAAREQRPNDEGLWPSKFSWWLGEQGTRFCRKRWPPTMRAVVRGLIGTALFRWFVGFSSTPKPCTVAFAILRNVPELARWTSRPLLEFGRGTFCSHVSGFPASHTATGSTKGIYLGTTHFPGLLSSIWPSFCRARFDV